MPQVRRAERERLRLKQGPFTWLGLDWQGAGQSELLLHLHE